MANKDEDVVWKTYPGIYFLQANQFGEIRTLDHYTEGKDGKKYLVKGHVLKQCADTDGYLQVFPCVNGKKVNLLVHRIVAKCFLPNPDNLPQVNHRDCNPKNNSVSNLEWCDQEYNITYREKYGIPAKEYTKALRKPLFAVNLKTLKVLHFKSQHEAAHQLKVSSGSINAVLNGRLRQAGGYWFTEDESEITEEKIQKIKDSVSKGVLAFDSKTKKISFFESQREAARLLGISFQNINKVLKGRRKTAGGYWFCYADSEAVEKTRAKFGDKAADEVEKLINEKM